MLRIVIVLCFAVVTACQNTSPYVSDAAYNTYAPVENDAALMAIVNGRTVEYTEQSNSGVGLRQTFNKNGTTKYGSQERVWSVVNGRYCSTAQKELPKEQWTCFKLDVNEAGTIIRWQRYPSDKQVHAPAGELDTWYGKIL